MTIQFTTKYSRM